MLNKTLIEIRKSLGFQSARAFYNDHLSRNSALDFNYSYYMKIEKGSTIPSPQIVASIARTVVKEMGDALILSYCKTIFSDRTALFKTPTAMAPKAVKPKSYGESAPALGKQQYLTPAQIACITHSREHYYSFLMLTLARTPVSLLDLGPSLKTKNFSQVVAELIKAKLIKREGDLLSSISNEMRFPAADSENIKKAYSLIDQWNQEFPAEMAFESRLQKMMLRRVSPRYLDMIQAQADLLLNLLRASDEVNTDLNEEVIMLNLSISRGQLPG